MIGWIDASSGASGDMLLGALLDAGVAVTTLQRAVDAVTPERVALTVERVTRNGFAATRCHVKVSESLTHRTWADIRDLLGAARLDATVRERATATFRRLAESEARVHGTTPEEVHFHEVGALDSIADVVGACAGFAALGLTGLSCSPIAVGGGRIRIAHGEVGVPAPAVVDLLRGIPSYGGPMDLELCTPTGAALLAEHVTDWGPQPAMATAATGVGAGGRDPHGHANVVRLVLGVATADRSEPTGPRLVETNIDDLDPRVWPQVIAALLAVGASDAWLTPILMKKGRPAHTLSVLTRPETADAVRREIFRQTSTIGLREQPVGKCALDREMTSVEVGGHAIAVKIARLGDEVLNRQPEYDDVVRAATVLGRPVKDVLAEAAALAHGLG